MSILTEVVPRRRKHPKQTPVSGVMRVLIPVTALILIFAVVFSTTGETAAIEAATKPTEDTGIKLDDLVYVVEKADTVIPEEKTAEEPAEAETETTEPAEETVEIPAEPRYTDEEVAYIAKTVYGEALVTHSYTEMSAVIWCILNRVDDTSNAWPDTIEGVVTQYKQFHGYSADNPVTEEIEWLVRDVLDRWYAEKDGAEDVGRTLPVDFKFFWGDGRKNHFTTEVYGKGTVWDWSLESPYES